MSESRHARVVQPEGQGRRVIAVIGIDDYRYMRKLSNAVSDASGALFELQKLGFELAVPPLLDGDATRHAIEGLVRRDLQQLSPRDSLILFFAGHGETRTHDVGVRKMKTGYLLPVDAREGEAATWIDVDTWLRWIARLPPRHILVVLDACYSGIALSSAAHWGRAQGQPALPFPELDALQSRKVITSALEDQIAADSGPKPGHSLFTGCLIDAVTGGVAGQMEYGAHYITGSQLAVWVQSRVRTYPGVQGGQTPGFGVFDYDERGEMMIPVRALHDAVTSTAIPINVDEERPSQPDLQGQVMQRDASAAIRQISLPPVPWAASVGKAPRGRRRGVYAAMGLVMTALGVGGMRLLEAPEADLPAPRPALTASVSVDAGVDAAVVSPDAAIASRGSASLPVTAAAKKRPPPAVRTPSPSLAPTAKHDEIAAARVASERAKERSAADATSSASAEKTSSVPTPPPADGRCVVPFKTNPKDAEIVVNGEVRGQTPMSLELPCGQAAAVVLSKPFYVPVTKTLTPEAGKSVFYVLRHQTVMMRVSSTPSHAEVSYSDYPNVSPGFTSGPMKIYVADKITLKFKLEGYETIERDINPAEGGEVHVKLRKLSD